MKRKLLNLLSIPVFALGLNSCNQELKEPVEEDFNDWVAPFRYNLRVKDLDNDGQVDVITHKDNNIALFYVEGYENKIDKLSTSKVMSSKLREEATNFLESYNKLGYQIAKDEYNSNKGDKN